MRPKERETARDGGAQAERNDMPCPYARNECLDAAEGIQGDHVEEKVHEVLVGEG